MPELDLSGFNVKPNQFEGLNQAAATLERNKERDQRLSIEMEGKQAATSKFLTNYLDPKDHLTGTNYDPQIVNGFQNVLQQAQGLASKGASTSDILMAIGPTVSKLNDYSTKAKLVNQQIKDSLGRLKGYQGYNIDALESEAKKAAFMGADGKMKDISSVDPNTDWVTEAVKGNPELVTTSKGLDDFVTKTPMQEATKNITTTYAGRSKNVQYKAEHPFYMGLQKDEKGNPLLDQSGNPIGLGVIQSPITGDDGKPMVNPATGKPFMAMDKGAFRAIMSHNPDIADFIRGQTIRHFKDAGAKEIPMEGSPQWELMARSVLGDELATRNKSHFNVINTEKESAPAIKVELGRDPNALDALAQYETAVKLKGDYAYLNPKTGKEGKTNAVQALGQVLNNNPDFLQGEQENINGRNVVDVTAYMPGGGLKSGRGSDEVYKQIYYDPTKRSLMVSTQPKVKDATGQKPISMEEIPEAQVGKFMSRIASANGIDPTQMGKLYGEMGYTGGKFSHPADYGIALTDRLKSEQSDKVDTALKNDDYSTLKGMDTKEGVIQKIDTRSITMFGARDKYAVSIKTTDGKTKTITFPDKDKLTEYLKENHQSAPAKGTSGVQWK